MKKVIYALTFVAVSVIQLNAEVIKEWTCWGPGWGRGGLATSGAYYEAGLKPQAGDLDLSLGTDRLRLIPWIKYFSTDGLVDFYSDKFPVKNILDGAGKWAGGASYTAVYIKLPQKQQLKLKLKASQGAKVWLNSTLLKVTGYTTDLTVQPGWNRLLIKSMSPSLIRHQKVILSKDGMPSNWTLKAELLNADGSAEIPNLQLSTADPVRAEIDACLRFDSKITGDDGRNPLFAVNHWNSKLKMTVTVASGKAESFPKAATKRYRNKAFQHWIYTRSPLPEDKKVSPEELKNLLPEKVKMEVIDFAGKQVISTIVPMAFNETNTAAVAFELPKQISAEPGSYSVMLSYLDKFGKVIVYNNLHHFAVTSGPVPKQTVVSRKISAVGHWLTNAGDFNHIKHKLEWMNLAGITWHQKMSQVWSKWGISHDTDGKIKFIPRENVDKTIELAEKLNITLIGDLTMGYVQTDIKRDGQMMALTADEVEADQKNSQAIAAANNIRLIPLGARPLPVFGDKLFNKVLYEYAHTLVSHYKGKIKYWCGDNEIDLHAGKAGPGEALVYATAAREYYKALKDANPEAIFISASICRNNAFTKMLFEQGFGENCDWIDVHAHPCEAPDLDDVTIGNTSKEGYGAAKDYSDKPIVYGETSAPLAHSPVGAIGQADAIPKQVAWIEEQEKIKLISYLVPYSNGANLGMCNIYGDPLPAVCALNTVSHLIDGREQLPKLKLADGIQQLRVKGDDKSDTLLLWSNIPVTVEIPLPQKSATIYDLLGRKRKVTANNGKLKLKISTTPQYITRPGAL